MPDYPMLPLAVQNDIEQLRSWEGLATPHDLALYNARVLGVDPNELLALQEIIYSDLEPAGEDDRKKLWIKTDSPAGIGIPTGDGYKVIYEYQPNIPLLWVLGENDLPSYMRLLTTQELEDYGLTKPAKNKYFWVIFEI